jgi:hypothetical protein
VTTVASYDFHQLAGFDLATDDGAAIRFFDAEYGAFKTTAGSAGEVRLSWQARRPMARPSNGQRFHAHKLLARWTYRISIGEGRVDLAADGNRWALPMIHHMMVHPALRYVVSGKGAVLLHGAAVVRDGRSLVISGGGGAGKTTTASLLLAHGGGRWQPHADDYVFLKPDGTTYAYPTRSHLYHNLLAWAADLGRRLTRMERLQLRGLWAVRRGTGERVKWPVRVEAKRLWPRQPTADRAQAGAVILIERGESQDLSLRPIPTQSFPVEDLVQMNFAEARHFLRLVELGAQPARPDDWLARWRAREAETLQQVGRRVPAFTLVIPRHPASRAEAARYLVEALEGIMQEVSSG